MREILFRGKRWDNGEWCYGDLINDPWGLVIQFLIESRRRCKLTIEPETVGQYTGITDKSGKRIFEGDIARKTVAVYPLWEEYPSGEHTIIGVVMWEYNCYVVRAKNEVGILVSYILDGEFEVIGNITDNPELIPE